MKVVDLNLAKIAIQQALSSEEVPAYSIFVFISSVNRLALAPRRGFIHGGLFAMIRDDLSEAERAVPIADEHVYDGFIEWEDGVRTIRLSSGKKPPLSVEQEIFSFIDTIGVE